MKTLWILTKRNMLMYIKDRIAVFFSLLSALIIIGLYAVFLADTNIKGVQAIIHTDRGAIANLINAWVMAGIIIVNTVTVTLGVLGNMIEDEVEHRLPSFLVSPLSRWKLTLGYILSAFIVGNLLCLVTFILSEIYIVSTGGTLLTWVQMLKVLGITFLCVFSSTCLVFFIVSLIRSRSAFTTISTIVGTLIGFIAGIYLPIGILPAAVQNFIKCVPFFYGASLMRDVFMTGPTATIFKGAPPSLISGYLESMGARVVWNGTVVSDVTKIGIILASGLVFLLLSVAVMRRRKLGKA